MDVLDPLSHSLAIHSFSGNGHLYKRDDGKMTHIFKMLNFGRSLFELIKI